MEHTSGKRVLIYPYRFADPIPLVGCIRSEARVPPVFGGC